MSGRDRAGSGRRNMVIEGRYELLEPVGSGAMGEVWRAHDRRLNRPVAVKGLLDRNALTADTQAAAMRRARREAEAIARIEHPNVVTVHDQVETDDQVWIVMKLLDAQSLAGLLTNQKTLSVPRAAEIARQILQGLRAVHAASVVHRDVKPGNVLVRDDGLVILVDFGIATFEGATPLTSSGSVIGTAPYLAPELFAPGSPGPTPASDLWALGVTLYEMVEGRRPFRGREVWEVQQHILASPVPAIRFALPLAPVIQGLLRLDPRERLDAATAEFMLDEVLDDPQSPEPDGATARQPVPVPAPEPEPESVRPDGVAPPVRDELAPEPRRLAFGKRAKVIVAATLSVVLLATVGWLVADATGSDEKDKKSGVAGSDSRGDGAQAPRWKTKNPRLRIGIKDDQPGLSERVKGEKNTFAGYDVDMAYKVAAELGYTDRKDVELVPVDTQNRDSALKKKAVHLVVASYTMRQDDEIDFVGPYYTAGRSFLVRMKSKRYVIKDASDLIRQRVEVCTARKSTYWGDLPKLGYTMMQSPPASYQRCLEQLLDDKSSVYAIASDDVILAGYVEKNPGKVRKLPNIDGVEKYGVAMLSGQSDLKKEVCSAVRNILADGEGWEDMYRDNLDPLIGPADRPGRPDLDPKSCTGP
ncbi:serine/threonine-protein kinase [Streptomyces sp. NPDC020875]|uniref:serine/threonine-protein kinase n=1 Tax=Streptomyces sp. NPDC020875 TaxID=3154898 RepID=UPI0034063521